MLSRVADSLYWMSRYLERAENTVRQLDVTMSLMLDTGGTNVETRWQRLLASLGKPAGMEWKGGLETMARALVFDSLSPASVTFCINGARENARQVREEISSEQWQRLNRLFHQMHSPHAQTQFSSSINDTLASVVDGIHLFQGVGDSTMIHGQGWQFIRLGRYLERAYATATMLEVYQAELFTRRSGSTPATITSSWWVCSVVARHSRPTARSTPQTSFPIAFSSSCCSTATFLTPSATAWIASVPQSIPSSTPAAAVLPMSLPRASAGSMPCWGSPPSGKFWQATRRRFCTTSASSACAFTSSSTATMSTTPFNPHWLSRRTPRF